MRRRFLLVSNTAAGRGRQDRVDAVVAELEGRGCSVDRLADGDKDTLHDGEKLKRFDGVIGAGGDGTIRRLLTTKAGHVVPIGIIPNGTGNVLAHEIGLIAKVSVIADVLIAGPEQPVQTAQCDTDTFLLMLSYGFDARVVHRLDLALKGRFGKFAYVGAVLQTLREPSPEFQLSIDGTEHSATWAIVANARRYGGGYMLAPQAALTKRSFEVVLFRSASLWVRVRQMLAIAAGRTHTGPETDVVAGKDIRLVGSRRGLKAQADGDPLDVCPIHVTMGRPVRLIVPRRYVR